MIDASAGQDGAPVWIPGDPGDAVGLGVIGGKLAIAAGGAAGVSLIGTKVVKSFAGRTRNIVASARDVRKAVAASGRPAVVIGENQTRVTKYAKSLRAGTYTGMPGYNELDGKIPKKVLDDLALEDNKRWIQNQMNSGTMIVDIGPDYVRRSRRGTISDAYIMERKTIENYDSHMIVFQDMGK
jgi:hypothetical protein